jgi:hypothetical protein
VRRGISAILNHPWIPASGPDAIIVRGFVYDVDTGELDEVSYPGDMGSIAGNRPEDAERVARTERSTLCQLSQMVKQLAHMYCIQADVEPL